MPILALTLPLARSSHLRIARRDIVADVGDDLTLHLALLADDSPEAAPVDLSATGTTLQMLTWYAPTWRDYGCAFPAGRSPLHTVAATITDAADGLATVTLPHDTGAAWPERLSYTLVLNLGGTARTALGWGALHMPRASA